VPHINQLFNAVHIQAHFIPIDCPQQQHQLADEQMRVSLYSLHKGGPCEVTSKITITQRVSLQAILELQTGGKLDVAGFWGKRREFLADMRLC
jgi:hypothetical protein